MKCCNSDAIQVVRCKDCESFLEYVHKYKQPLNHVFDGECKIRLVKDENPNSDFCKVRYNDYCSYGTRKE